jgi:hypothetical protein
VCAWLSVPSRASSTTRHWVVANRLGLVKQ